MLALRILRKSRMNGFRQEADQLPDAGDKPPGETLLSEMPRISAISRYANPPAGAASATGPASSSSAILPYSHSRRSSRCSGGRPERWRHFVERKVARPVPLPPRPAERCVRPPGFLTLSRVGSRGVLRWIGLGARSRRPRRCDGRALGAESLRPMPGWARHDRKPDELSEKCPRVHPS